MTNGWFTPDADTTGAIPAADPPAELSATQPAEPTSPELTPDPDTPRYADEAWRSALLSDDAATLHSLACACEYGADVEGHGVDFEELAAAFVARAIERDGWQLDVTPVRYPIEAKVVAGGKGALLAGLGVGLATLLLDHLGAIGTLYGGQFPWLGGVLAVLAVVLPAAIGTWQGYDAPHTPRADGR